MRTVKLHAIRHNSVVWCVRIMKRFSRYSHKRCGLLKRGTAFYDIKHKIPYLCCNFLKHTIISICHNKLGTDDQSWLIMKYSWEWFEMVHFLEGLKNFQLYTFAESFEGCPSFKTFLYTNFFLRCVYIQRSLYYITLCSSNIFMIILCLCNKLSEVKLAEIVSVYFSVAFIKYTL